MSVYSPADLERDLDWLYFSRILWLPSQSVLWTNFCTAFLPCNCVLGYDFFYWIQLDLNFEHYAIFWILKSDTNAIFDRQANGYYPTDNLLRTSYSFWHDYNHQLLRKPSIGLLLWIDCGQAFPVVHSSINYECFTQSTGRIPIRQARPKGKDHQTC